MAYLCAFNVFYNSAPLHLADWHHTVNVIDLVILV